MKFEASIIQLVFMFTVVAGGANEDSRVTRTLSQSERDGQYRWYYPCRIDFIARCIWKVDGKNISISDSGYKWKTGNGSNTKDCSIEPKSINTPKLSDDPKGDKVECIGTGNGPVKATIGHYVKLQCPVNNRKFCLWIRDNQHIEIDGRYQFLKNREDCSIRINEIQRADLTLWNCYNRNKPDWPRAIYTLAEQTQTEQQTEYPASETDEINSDATTTSTTSTVTTSKSGVHSTSKTSTTYSTTNTYKTTYTYLIATTPETFSTSSTTNTPETFSTNATATTPETVSTYSTATTPETEKPVSIHETDTTYPNLTTNSLNAPSTNSNTIIIIVVVAVVVTCTLALLIATVIYCQRRRKNPKDKRTASGEQKYNQISFNATSEDVTCPMNVSESNYMTLSGPFPRQTLQPMPTSNRPPPINVNDVDRSNDVIYTDVVFSQRSLTDSRADEVSHNNVGDVTYAVVMHKRA